jgi:trk system potassium uptake protein TrkA
MRIALMGASPLAIAAARTLVHQGNDVVVIDRSREKIDALSDQIDCGFVHGDGAKPGILKEIGPEQTDILMCLSNDDQANILASLVGRSLGFGRVVTKVEDPEYEHVCLELGLTDLIIPDRYVAQSLVDLVSGVEPGELSPMIKGDARLFSFIVGADDEVTLADLDLPDGTQVVCLYRSGEFLLPDDKLHARAGDEVMLITHRRNLPRLRERWGAGEGGEKSA